MPRLRSATLFGLAATVAVVLPGVALATSISSAPRSNGTRVAAPEVRETASPWYLEWIQNQVFCSDLSMFFGAREWAASRGITGSQAEAVALRYEAAARARWDEITCAGQEANSAAWGSRR